MYKLKILIVSPTLGGGGAEKVAVNLVNYYHKLKFDVSLLAFRAEGPYAKNIDSGIRVLSLGSRIRGAFAGFFKVVIREKPDVILSVIRSANIVSGLISYLNRRPILIFREAATMYEIENYNSIKKWFFKNLMRISYRNAGVVIANSKDTKADLIKYNITDGKKIIVLGNPVVSDNIYELANQEIFHPWLDNPTYRVLVTAGRLHPDKNQSMLIEGFAGARKKLNDLKLIILGDGPERDILKKLTQKFHVSEHIDFIPFQSNPYPFYKKADLFVLTSNWEGFGNVLVEAMACGTPVISTDCPGGPKEILNNGEYGILVPRGNVDALVKAILDSLQSGASSDKVLERAKMYSIRKIALEYLSQSCFEKDHLV